jgi:hypothetical protein
MEIIAALGYHHFFLTKAGNPYYFALIPRVTDNRLEVSC